MDSSQDKKPKILVIITQSEMGGAQRFLIQMANGLKDDFYFEIATGADGSGEIFSYFKGLPTYTIRSLKRNISPLDDIKSLFEIRDLIIKTRPDKLFLMSSKAGFNGAIAGLLVDKSSRPEVIYRIGGWAFNDPGSIFKKAIYFGLELISAPFKDTIIVNSLHDFKQAKKWHIEPRHNLELVHNGLNLSDSDFFDKEEARRKLGLEASDFVVGCIANFYATKGLDILIDAINLTKDKEIKCVIIGDGELRHDLEDKIKSYNLQDKIILAGKRNDAYKYLKAFDIYISPSRKEGFAWAILEAMNAGLPVIATRVGSAEEMIEDRVNGILVKPNSPRLIAASIKDILLNSDNMKNLGDKARQSAHENFSENAMLNKIKTILNK